MMELLGIIRGLRTVSNLLTIWIPLEGVTPNFVKRNFQHNKSLFKKSTFINMLNYPEILKEALKDYRIKSMFQRPNSKNQFEQVRAWWLWKNPNYVYCDADVKILKMWNIREGDPAFAEGNDGHLDNFIIDANGCGQFFNDMLDRMYEKHPTQCFPMVATIPKYHDNVIKKEYFEHKKF